MVRPSASSPRTFEARVKALDTLNHEQLRHLRPAVAEELAAALTGLRTRPHTASTSTTEVGPVIPIAVVQGASAWSFAALKARSGLAPMAMGSLKVLPPPQSLAARPATSAGVSRSSQLKPASAATTGQRQSSATSSGAARGYTKSVHTRGPRASSLSRQNSQHFPMVPTMSRAGTKTLDAVPSNLCEVKWRWRQATSQATPRSDRKAASAPLPSMSQKIIDSRSQVRSHSSRTAATESVQSGSRNQLSERERRPGGSSVASRSQSVEPQQSKRNGKQREPFSARRPSPRHRRRPFSKR